jgi:hypothetical protein
MVEFEFVCGKGGKEGGKEGGKKGGKVCYE